MAKKTSQKRRRSRPIAGMGFGEAMTFLLSGGVVRRRAWPSDDVFVLRGGVLLIVKPDGSIHRLILSDGDIGASDYVRTEIGTSVRLRALKKLSMSIDEFLKRAEFDFAVLRSK